MFRKLSLGLIAALSLACMTVGEDFAVGKVSQIEIGKTTQADLQKMLGEPWSVGLEDGRRSRTWGYYKYNLFGTSQRRDLVVRFDDRGVVRSFTFNSTWPEDVL